MSTAVNDGTLPLGATADESQLSGGSKQKIALKVGAKSNTGTASPTNERLANTMTTLTKVQTENK